MAAIVQSFKGFDDNYTFCISFDDNNEEEGTMATTMAMTMRTNLIILFCIFPFSPKLCQVDPTLWRNFCRLWSDNDYDDDGDEDDDGDDDNEEDEDDVPAKLDSTLWHCFCCLNTMMTMMI